MLLTQPKVTLTVDGAVVEGEFVHLQPNDIRVRLRKPFDDGQTAGLHRPYFAMPYGQFCSEEGEVTELGMSRAQQLVKKLYDDYHASFQISTYLRQDV
ncbi:hypothetical protein N9W75_00170 [Porticoccaceae bacterium]|nr:hypothetical protein [Porticoccaceae bacterium]